MLAQLALGTLVILISTLIAGIGFLVLERALGRARLWLSRPPHPPKLLLLLCGSVFWILVVVTVAVWLWAGLFLALGLFATIEGAVYFALVAFTTLGFGDVLLPPGWELLSGLAAINGLLMIGLQTAMLVEVMRRVRMAQADTESWPV